MTAPVTVIILSRNRPLYLWACLDALYSYTRHPARFVLVDNASDDPDVRAVVRGFERRGMFNTVEWHTENEPRRAFDAIARHGSAAHDYFAFIESDVMVTDTTPCWLGTFVAMMEKYPDHGYLGSYVDSRDFIPLEQGAELLPDATEADIAGFLKSESVERTLPPEPPDADLILPFNPPGRLLMARRAILHQMIFANDMKVFAHAKALGIKAAITPRVRHRHLSLLNAYDYPDYDLAARNRFHSANTVTTRFKPPEDPKTEK